VRQLRGAQSLKLCPIRMQFQFGGQHLPHRTSVRLFTENVKREVSVNMPNPSPKQRTPHPSTSPWRGRDSCGVFVESESPKYHYYCASFSNRHINEACWYSVARHGEKAQASIWNVCK